MGRHARASGVVAVAVALVTVLSGAPRTQILVRTSGELSAALARAAPGTTIALAPGVYQGGVSATSVAGTAGSPVVIEAADPARLPVIRGGGHGMQLTRVRHVTVRRIVFEGQRDHGINIDDGGTSGTPSQHITLGELAVRNVLNPGVAAGIKLSGVQDFVIEHSTIADWGGGSAITMIGTHRGVIRGNVFSHRDDQGATGLHMKGGSTGIVVRGNRFEHAGLRAVQIGGATGAQFFRPQPPAGYEARDCTVEHNVFVGSEAVVAFVNVDGSTFRHNTIYRPRKWLLRILQEVRTPGFVPSRRGVVTDNLIYYVGDDFPAGAANVGDGTDAASFRFERNWWYRADRPGASRQSLPSEEMAGMYGSDPMFVDAERGDFRLIPGSPARAYGASEVEAGNALIGKPGGIQ